VKFQTSSNETAIVSVTFLQCLERRLMVATYIRRHTLLFINLFRIHFVFDGLDVGFILILKHEGDASP